MKYIKKILRYSIQNIMQYISTIYHQNIIIYLSDISIKCNNGDAFPKKVFTLEYNAKWGIPVYIHITFYIYV
jgi:hypothetical protein